ncbi:MAG TPA: hypothetical protein VF226_20410 [Hyphomicrobiaceae bacterium]
MVLLNLGVEAETSVEAIKNNRKQGVDMWATFLSELREIALLVSIVGSLLAVSVGLAAALAVIVA